MSCTSACRSATRCSPRRSAYSPPLPTSLRAARSARGSASDGSGKFSSTAAAARSGQGVPGGGWGYPGYAASTCPSSACGDTDRRIIRDVSCFAQAGGVRRGSGEGQEGVRRGSRGGQEGVPAVNLAV
eukprot:131890-Prorocentrum_minimum.AAC.1